MISSPASRAAQKPCQAFHRPKHAALLLPAPSPTIPAEISAVPKTALRSFPCSAAVTAQINGLYRWQLARQESQRGPIDISSQKNRFTPDLYNQLKQAFALQPSDGRFVDFDVFSGTQVLTFWARVKECRKGHRGGTDALVAVQAGLRGHRTDPPRNLLFHGQEGPAGSWKIADITYLTQDNPPFRLSTFLAGLLPPKR